MAVITTEQLRAKADELGVSYTTKTTDDILLAKIEEAEAKKNATEAYEAHMKAKKEATLKYRVRVSALNPVEKNIKSKLFSLMNSETDETVVVYFDKPWFLTRNMIDHIKSIQYVSVPSNLEADGIGAKTVEKLILPAYNVMELGPISEAEFKNMKETKMLNDAAHEKVA